MTMIDSKQINVPNKAVIYLENHQMFALVLHVKFIEHVMQTKSTGPDEDSRLHLNYCKTCNSLNSSNLSMTSEISYKVLGKPPCPPFGS